MIERLKMGLRWVLLLSVMSGFAFSQPVTMNADLEIFQREKRGLVKPSLGFSPESGLREGEMNLHGQSMIVELALDNEAQARGLMFRTVMADNAGMLFMFPQTQPLSFWMKNTLIPLDIIYITEAGEIVDIVSAKPCRVKNCPTYPSSLPAKYVLELTAGRAAALGLAVGDNLHWSWK